MKVASTFVSRRVLLGGSTLAVALACCGARAEETGPRLAIKGYDPVAYFTPGKPMPGSADISYVWDGARWQFADAAHRALFERNPESYAPQYGGYCAMGMVTGNRGQVNPEIWTIVDGKLYLNYDDAALEEWRQNQAAYIAQANEVWAKTKN